MKRQEENTKGKRYSLQWSMIRMLVLCWLLPLALLAFIMLFFMSTKLSEQTENTILASANKAVEICQMQIEDARLASRNASYMPTIRESYYTYQKDQNKRKFYNTVNQFLDQQYKYNKNFLSTMLIFLDDKDMVYYTYSNTKKSTYASVREFKKVGMLKALERAEEMGTNIELLNTSIENVLTEQELMTVTDKSVYFNRKSVDIVYCVRKLEQHTVAFVIQLDSNALIRELDVVKYIGFLVILFMIPLIILIIRFFNQKVSKPIKALVEGAHQIANGQYGYQVDGDERNNEFTYLSHVFNQMSLELQYQFEKIYVEELALRDAKIKALQSQINPHFLNNTLEIINWEARLSGNERVSGMIEALSTMLYATMNRKNQHMISLEEELSYVEAYLYIIKQRFGEQLEIEKQIDERLLSYRVPRLIIQPIVENAVEHGIGALRKGKIKLSIYEEEHGIVVEVEDSGTLSELDKKKIHEILEREEINFETNLNLGIRNVNQRLNILYGKNYGLTIKNNQNNNTISLIRIGKYGIYNNIIQ